MDQTLVILVILALGFGALRAFARVVAWGVILLVIVPALVTSSAVDIDWAALGDAMRDRAAWLLDIDPERET